MRYLPFVLLLALVVYALVDCVRSKDADMPVGLPKTIWVILIIIFPAAGAIAWLVVSRMARRAMRAPGPAAPSYGSHPSRPVQRRPVTRQVAPDDDPDFLASLDRPKPAPEPGAPPQPDEEPGTDADGSGTDDDSQPGTRR